MSRIPGPSASYYYLIYWKTETRPESNAQGGAYRDHSSHPFYEEKNASKSPLILILIISNKSTQVMYLRRNKSVLVT